MDAGVGGVARERAGGCVEDAQPQDNSRHFDARSTERATELPVELAAFVGLLDPAILDAAPRRASRLGVGGDEVLRCQGLLPPELITEALAEHLGLSLDPLRRAREPVSLAAACAGVLARNEPGWSRSITVAPRGLGLRQLAEALERDPRNRVRSGDHRCSSECAG